MAICPKFHRLVIAVGALLLVALLLVPQQAQSQASKTLRIGIASDLSPINPFTTSSTFSANFAELIFQSLITLDKNFELTPSLAKSWRVNQNGTEWIFELDRAAEFHDSQKVSANDVVFSFSVLKGIADYLYKSVIDNIVSVDKIDDHTVKVVLKQADQQFKYFLHNFSIVPSHLFDVNGQARFPEYEKTPVGSGPFKVTDFTKTKLVLTRVNNSRPSIIDEIVISVHENDRSLLAKIINNEIDMMLGSDLRNHSIAESIQGLSVFEYQSNHLYGLFLNNANPLFSQKDVRAALNLAVDKSKIVDSLIKNQGVVATVPVPPDRFFSNLSLTPDNYAPQQALDLLKNLGWELDADLVLKNNSGDEFRFEVLIPHGDDLAERTAKFIQNDLEKIGVIVSLKKINMSSIVDAVYVRHEYAATIHLYNHIYPILSDYALWADGNNFAAYDNPEVVDHLYRARFTTDELASRTAYTDFQQAIHDDPPAVFLFWKKSPILISSAITGLEASPYLFFRSMGNVQLNQDKFLSTPEPKYLSQIRKLIGLQTQ